MACPAVEDPSQRGEACRDCGGKGLDFLGPDARWQILGVLIIISIFTDTYTQYIYTQYIYIIIYIYYIYIHMYIYIHNVYIYIYVYNYIYTIYIHSQ